MTHITPFFTTVCDTTLLLSVRTDLIARTLDPMLDEGRYDQANALIISWPIDQCDTDVLLYLLSHTKDKAEHLTDREDLFIKVRDKLIKEALANVETSLKYMH
tara:strand:- start:9067 stop:9375 length:309 start_codon:yes stop_codon:yes gene_type:complete